jgi:hypothetical protein
MPLAAPVTNATFPVKRPVSLVSIWLPRSFFQRPTVHRFDDSTFAPGDACRKTTGAFPRE